MKIHFEKEILGTALTDLARPHEFAFERIGYFIGDSKEDQFVATDWLSFSDDVYEKTSEVGARIGRAGMKELMSKAISTNKSFLQFHLHEFEDKPHFSHTDLNSLHEIIPALFRFSSANMHGGIIMGSTHFTSLTWTQGQIVPLQKSFTILTKKET